MNRIISTAAVAILVSSAAAHAATFVDFESPTYTAGGAWSGVDGWVGSPAFAKVSPDTASGYTWVVEGQSGTVIGGSLRRGFGSTTDQISSAGFDVSVSLQRPENPATAVGEWYVSDNLGVSRQAGIQLSITDNGKQVLVWSGGAFHLIPLSTITWAVGQSYETTLQLDLTPGANKFTALIRNVTADGPLINLGTYALDGGDLHAANFIANGGIEVASPSGATIFDNINVTGVNVPEPASAAVLLLGGALLARRVRRA